MSFFCLADHEIMCIYKALQLPSISDNTDTVMESIGTIQLALSSSDERNLSLEQFYHFYKVLGMKWELVCTLE